MSFDEIRLSEEVERGAQGGPGFKTQVLTLESGFEKRNRSWAQTRGRWDVSYGLQDMDSDKAILNIRALLDFFYARGGKERGFRYKDWTDYKIGNPDFPTSDFDQIAVADGVATSFQVVKLYTSGSNTYDRVIKKLVAGTGTVLVNGVPDLSAVIDVNTGLVTPTALPANGDLIQFAGEFDVPVRFDTDDLGIRMEVADEIDVASIPGIELVELRIE